MDIVNWSALQTNLLVRDSLSSPDDLVLVGAAAAAGVPLSGIYRNGSVLQIRAI